jgi:hypothetical protein
MFTALAATALVVTVFVIAALLMVNEWSDLAAQIPG